jgi:hypothetical protein
LECRPQRLQLAALFRDRHAEFADVFPRNRYLVASHECNIDSRWLVVAPLACSIGANPVGARAPLAWSTALAGNRHDSTVTKRNETVHHRVIICEGDFGSRFAGPGLGSGTAFAWMSAIQLTWMSAYLRTASDVGLL